ncbi:MAG TPA: helix-turn-helix transcriptional regulator [Steroidobacteraceae bacterium]|nr:helix-turn-helix transcriptional regulator [Steroidobacteraceae bacterium]
MAARRTIKGIQGVLARNVKKYRKRTKLSQETLSRRCGLHHSYVGRLERSGGNPELSTIKRLADRLGVTVVDLLTARKRKS